ncbi:MAG: PspC domain-containing protein [bacterium]
MPDKKSLTTTEDQDQGNAGDAPNGSRRLYRSGTDRYLAGVCGGFAEYFQVDPLLVRIIWVAACFLGGVGLISYIAAWIIVPENPQLGAPSVQVEPEKSRKVGLALGIILIFVGLLFIGDNLRYHFMFPWGFRGFDLGIVVSLVVIGLGAYLLFKKSQSENESLSDVNTGTSPFAGKKLTRSVVDRKIGGVCGGMAKYFEIDPALARIGFVVLALAQLPLVVIAYIVMMIVVPEDNDETIVSEGNMTSM